METFIFVFLGFFSFMFLMFVGYLLTGKELKGSCGGINQQFTDFSCEVCYGEDEQEKTVCSNSEDCDKKDDCPLYKQVENA